MHINITQRDMDFKFSPLKSGKENGGKERRNFTLSMKFTKKELTKRGSFNIILN